MASLPPNSGKDTQLSWLTLPCGTSAAPSVLTYAVAPPEASASTIIVVTLLCADLALFMIKARVFTCIIAIVFLLRGLVDVIIIGRWPTLVNKVRTPFNLFSITDH